MTKERAAPDGTEERSGELDRVVEACRRRLGAAGVPVVSIPYPPSLESFLLSLSFALPLRGLSLGGVGVVASWAVSLSGARLV